MTIMQRYVDLDFFLHLILYALNLPSNLYYLIQKTDHDQSIYVENSFSLKFHCNDMSYKIKVKYVSLCKVVLLRRKEDNDHFKLQDMQR